jgi:tetratricopeptide (TPR) repeat protein
MSILSVSGGPKKLRSIFKDERFRASPYVQAFEIQYRIAASLRSGESLQEMFDRLDRAAESRSRDPGLQFVRGMIYDSVGRREAALHSYERALEAYDGFFPASYVLGIEYLRRRDFKRALVQFEHTTGHRPYAHIGAYGLAKALMGLHRYDEAASWLRTVIDYDPSFAPAVFELARCHVAAGDLARAGQSVVRLRQLSARWARRLEALIENETLHPRAVRPLPRATVSLALPPPDGV